MILIVVMLIMIEKKLKKGIEEAQSFSKKNSIKKQSKNLQKINNEKNLGSNSNNNMNIENNLNNNLNNNNIINNIDNNNNIILKDGNDLNTNINNNQNNIIDNNTNILNNFEEDEKLRKKIFKFESISNPRLINFPLVKNQNPLYNLIFQCLCNIKSIVGYYFNPSKEDKILQKSKQYPNETFLSPSFLKLLDHFWKGEQNTYNLSEINQALQTLIFKTGNIYSDPGDILDFILKQLNSELIQNNQSIPCNLTERDHYYKERVNSFYQIFCQTQVSKISNIFYSFLDQINICQMCNSKSYFGHFIPVINIYLNQCNNIIHFNKDLQSLLSPNSIYESCPICGSENTEKKIEKKN